MAATGLSRPRSQTARRWSLPAKLPAAWSYAYMAVWAATLIPAGLIALAGPALAFPVRHLLGLTLTPRHNPPPTVGHVLLSVAHNTPIVSWPLLLGVIGAHRHRFATRIADGLLLACIIVNTLQVGAALGAYGTRVLPYLPQLPLEWAGLALGGSTWLVQRHRALTAHGGLLLFALIVSVLLCSAVLETVAVPHQ